MTAISLCPSRRQYLTQDCRSHATTRLKQSEASAVSAMRSGSRRRRFPRQGWNARARASFDVEAASSGSTNAAATVMTAPTTSACNALLASRSRKSAKRCAYRTPAAQGRSARAASNHAARGPEIPSRLRLPAPPSRQSEIECEEQDAEDQRCRRKRQWPHPAQGPRLAIKHYQAQPEHLMAANLTPYDAVPRSWASAAWPTRET